MPFVFADCILDETTRELVRAGRSVDVQPKVFDLLVLLARARGRVVEPDAIETALWPEVAVSSDALRRLAKEARKCLGDDGSRQRIIATVRGHGYRIKVPVESANQLTLGDSSLVGDPDLVTKGVHHIETALRSGSALIAFVGGAGVGKTRFVHELLQRLEERGIRTIAVRPPAIDAPPAFATIAALARRLETLSLDDDAPTRTLLDHLSPGSPALGRQDPIGLPAADPEALTIAIAFAKALRNLSDDGPLVIAIDDLHRADLGSLAAIGLMLDEIGGAPVMILANTRDGMAHPAAAHLIERLLSRPESTRWPILPLSQESSIDLLRIRSVRDVSQELGQAAYRVTRGNPMLIEELAREYSVRDWPPLESVRLETVSILEVMLQRRLAALSSAENRCLFAAAVLGNPFDANLVAHVSDLAPDDVERYLESAAELAVVEANPDPQYRMRFVCAEFREILYRDSLGRALKSEFHERAADAILERHGDDHSAELARHYLLSERVESKTRGIKFARLAAARASALGAWSESTFHLRSVAELLDHDRDRVAAGQAWLEVAESEIHSSGLEAARSSAYEAIKRFRGIDACGLSSAALVYADRPTQTGVGDSVVVALLEEAIKEGPTDQSVLILLRSRLATENRYRDPAKTRQVVANSVDLARALGNPFVLGRVLDDFSYVTFAADDPSAWLAINADIIRSGLHSNDASVQLSGHKGRVTEFLELGDLESLSRELDECRSLAERLGSPYARWFVASVEATLSFLKGDFKRAQSFADVASREGGRTQSPDVLVQVGAQAFYVALEKGNVADLEPAVLDFRERFPGTSAWKAAHALLLTETGRQDEAIAELEDMTADQFQRMPLDRGWLLAMGIAAEVSATCQHTKLARVVYDRLESYRDLFIVIGSASLFYGSVEHWLGRLAVCNEEFSLANEHLEKAIAAHQRLQAEPWIAHSLQARAELRSAEGDTKRVATDRAAAVRIANRLGLSRLQDRAAIVFPRLP